MRIPKQFNLQGHTYKVVRTPPPEFTKKQVAAWDGASNQSRTLCWVKKELKGDYAEHVFYHELAHLLMMHLGEYKLNENEVFIDALGGLLHQFEKTRK